MRHLGLLCVFLGLASHAAAEPRKLAWPVPARSPFEAAATVAGARADLRPTRVLHSRASTHVWMAQLASDGTPVLGSERAVHLAGAAPLYTARSADDLPGRVTLEGVRRLGLDEAAALAQAAVPGAIAVRPPEAVAVPVGPGRVRPAVRVLVDTEGALRETLVDAETGSVTVGRDLLVRVDGSGKVYRPNPMTESGDRTLRDDGGADSPELTALLETVTLKGLDGSGNLAGEYADVRRRSTRLNVPSLTFDLTRGQAGFDEVSAYYHVDRAQRYVQSLGFTGEKGIRAEPLPVITDGTIEDNSNYDPGSQTLNMGTGGVDDAEDGDVVVHEYGHALQYFILPTTGASEDSRGLGEGWGDTLAGHTPTLSDHAPKIDRACLAPWDASAYKPPQDCLRRVDGHGHYPEALAAPREAHTDGQIWSGALHDLFNQPDVGVDTGMTLVLESLYLYTSTESFAAAGHALESADADLFAGAHFATIRRVMLDHGVVADLTPAPPEGAVVETVPTSISSPGGKALDDRQVISHPGALALRVHVATMQLDSNLSCPGKPLCDGLYFYDKAGNLYAHIGGTQSDVLSPIIPGDEVQVRLVTRDTSASTGYTIDRYESIAPGPVPDAPIPSVPDAGVPDAPAFPDAPAPAARMGGGGCDVAGGSGGLALVLIFIAGARGWARRRRTSRS